MEDGRDDFSQDLDVKVVGVPFAELQYVCCEFMKSSSTANWPEFISDLRVCMNLPIYDSITRSYLAICTCCYDYPSRVVTPVDDSALHEQVREGVDSAHRAGRRHMTPL